VLELERTSKQRIELRLNRGRLFYTKSGISESWKYQFGLEIIKLAPATYLPGGQTKSNFHNIEHPVVIVGQWSTSSSEDG
jgi:hypothetical protein